VKGGVAKYKGVAQVTSSGIANERKIIVQSCRELNKEAQDEKRKISTSIFRGVRPIRGVATANTLQSLKRGGGSTGDTPSGK